MPDSRGRARVACPSLVVQTVLWPWKIVLQDGLAGRLELRRNSIDVLPDAEEVPANNLGRIRVADPAPEQLGDEIGIAGHIFQPFRNGLNAVEITPQTDVVEADEIADVQNVRGDVRESRIRRIEIGQPVVPAGLDARDKIRRKVDHDQRVRLLHQLENMVGDVSGVRADAVRARVAVDDRSLGSSISFLAA